MTLPPSPWDYALSRSYDSIFSVTATVQFPISIPDFASSSFIVHQTLVNCHLLANEQDIYNWCIPEQRSSASQDTNTLTPVSVSNTTSRMKQPTSVPFRRHTYEVDLFARSLGVPLFSKQE